MKKGRLVVGQNSHGVGNMMQLAGAVLQPRQEQ